MSRSSYLDLCVLAPCRECLWGVCAQATRVLVADAGDLRLAGGAKSDVRGAHAQFGRLEVFSNGGWGAVCDRRGDRYDPNRDDALFTDASVTVACKQLGFSAGIKISVFVRTPCGSALPIHASHPHGRQQSWDNTTPGIQMRLGICSLDVIRASTSTARPCACML